MTDGKTGKSLPGLGATALHVFSFLLAMQLTV
jgi:hypothetical protein